MLTFLCIILSIQSTFSRLLAGSPRPDADSIVDKIVGELKRLPGGDPRERPEHHSHDPLDHLVEDLPGLPSDYSSRMYAGHVRVWEPTIQNRGSLFYWLVESQGDPENDPLLIWLNGGPGCSSMEGLLAENGPFWIHNDARHLYTNQWSWNRHANVLYIDQPVGTGLSVVVDNQFAQNQTEVDTMFATFLHNWFKMYPQYRDRDLWFSGESYAGHYIPYFAFGIKDGRGAFRGLEDLKIRGLMIGNGWSHPLIQTQSWPEYGYNSGLIGWQERHYLEKLAEECGHAYSEFPLINPNPLPENETRYRNVEREHRWGDDETNPKGEKEMKEMEVHLPGADNPGRIRSAPLAVPQCNKIFESLLSLSGSPDTGLINIYDIRLYDTTAGDAWPPAQNYMGPYLNRPEVRRALHAMELYEWKECSGPVNRALGRDNMIATRPIIVKLMDEYNVPILVYNGQFDFICNHVGTEAYLSTMSAWTGLPDWLKTRRGIWNVNKKIAGYVKASGNLTFLLVLGGSHMVPMDVPEQTYDMIRRFMSGKQFDDEYPTVNVPFTPTVPYIPGDTVPDKHYDASREVLSNIEAFNVKSSDGAFLGFALPLLLFCVIFVSVVYYLFNNKRSEYQSVAEVTETVDTAEQFQSSDILLHGGSNDD